MLIFAPVENHSPFDPPIPVGLCMAIFLVATTLSTATVIGILVCLWRLL